MKMKDDFSVAGCGGTNGKPHLAPARPTLAVDVERYQAYLDGSDFSDAQKEEFLQALWSIIVSFVELGFGVHPLQEVCGKDRESADVSPKADFNRLGSPDSEPKLNLDRLIARLEAE